MNGLKLAFPTVRIIKEMDQLIKTILAVSQIWIKYTSISSNQPK